MVPLKVNDMQTNTQLQREASFNQVASGSGRHIKKTARATAQLTHARAALLFLRGPFPAGPLTGADLMTQNTFIKPRLINRILSRHHRSLYYKLKSVQIGENVDSSVSVAKQHFPVLGHWKRIVMFQPISPRGE